MDVFKQNQLKIARKVLNENPLFSELTNTMSQEQAKEIVREAEEKNKKRDRKNLAIKGN